MLKSMGGFDGWVGGGGGFGADSEGRSKISCTKCGLTNKETFFVRPPSAVVRVVVIRVCYFFIIMVYVVDLCTGSG